MAGLGHKRGRGGGWARCEQSPFIHSYSRWLALLPPSSFLSSRHYWERRDDDDNDITSTLIYTMCGTKYPIPSPPSLLAPQQRLFCLDPCFSQTATTIMPAPAFCPPARQVYVLILTYRSRYFAGSVRRLESSCGVLFGLRERERERERKFTHG